MSNSDLSNGSPALSKTETAGTITITPEIFEKMYLSPQTKVTGSLRTTFGVPSGLALCGFALSISPLSCDLMGLRGAGGNGAASIGTYFFLGGLLMFTAGVLEFILGNTYPFVLFCGYGGWWLAFGATLQPFYGAFGDYSPSAADPAMGLDTQGFAASFGFFLTFMGVFTFIMLVCALRVNVALTFILFFVLLTYCILAGAFFTKASHGPMAAHAGTLQVAGGATAFVASMGAWYLFAALMLEAIDFPVQLPVFDLSEVVKGKTQKKKKGME